MNPASLRSTLPEANLATCVPALARGFVRCFDVGFPNDGSQPDKRYFDAEGHSPEYVLLGNIRTDSAYWVNGVCIPVNDSDLEKLIARERRYLLVDISENVTLYMPSSPTGAGGRLGQVMTFIGQPKFILDPSEPSRLASAFLSRAYLDSITAGSHFWDERAPEFHHFTMGSTLFPPRDQIAVLERHNL